MAGFELRLSNIVIISTLVLVVVGLVFALLWYFKKASALTEDDRLHIERAKVAWIGAVALGVLVLVSMKQEKYMKVSMGSRGMGSSSLL